MLVRHAPTRREAGYVSWCAGTGFALAMHHWLAPNLTVFTPFVAVAIGALWIMWGRVVWSLLAAPSSPGRAAAALAIVPSAWVAIEAVRSWERLGGPWGLLGASQWNRSEMLAPAALGGVWLVSLLIVAANTGAALVAMRGMPPRTRALGAFVLVAAVTAGPLRYATQRLVDDGETFRVAVVQPGVEHRGHARFEAQEELTRTLVGDGVDLVVWGESSVSFDLAERPDLTARLEALSRAVGADILVNTDARRGTSGGIYKSSVLVGPDGERGRYDKMRLVPFGEYVPLRFLFGWTGAVTEAADEDRRRGDRLEILHTAGIGIGPLVCFESAFPDLTRRLARHGADLVVVQSATSTFQGSWAPEQHAALAAVRAVEIGRPVVHATLTGVTAGFDARGRRLGWLGTDEHGVIVMEIPLRQTWAPHTWTGEWVPALSFTILAIGAIAAGVRAARVS
jgi:apolipoprotein N-acyltransferase